MKHKIIPVNFAVPILGCLLILGCATMQSRYKKAKRIDTIPAYKEFLNKHPDSPYSAEINARIKQLNDEAIFKEVESKNTTSAYKTFIDQYPNNIFIEEAQRRITQSDLEAYIRTWRLGAVQPFRGFIESYPTSKYIPEAKARIHFLEMVTQSTIGAYRKFIEHCPHSPFISEAKSTFPILWLCGDTAAVVIDIYKAYSANSDTVRKELWHQVQNGLEKIGLQGILVDMDYLKGANYPRRYPISAGQKRYIIHRLAEAFNDKKVSALLVIDYTEEPLRRRREPYSLSPTQYNIEKAQENILTLLYGPRLYIDFTVSIKDAETLEDYYSRRFVTIREHWIYGGKEFDLGEFLQVKASLPELITALGQSRDAQATMFLITALSNDNLYYDLFSQIYRCPHCGRRITDVICEPDIIHNPNGWPKCPYCDGPLAWLGDTYKTPQKCAINALKKIEKPPVELLITLLKDKSPQVRIGVIDALETVGGEQVREHLEEVFQNDSDLNVRKAAKEALEKISQSR